MLKPYTQHKLALHAQCTRYEGRDEVSYPFTDAFHNMTPEEREDYHRTVFLQMNTPKAAALRNAWYRTQLGSAGAKISIGAGVTIVNPQWVFLGDGVSIEDGCTLIARSPQGITLGDGTSLKHRVYLDTESAEGQIVIGQRVYIGTGCCLHGHRGLFIGDDTLLAQCITITPYSHHFDNRDQRIIEQGGHCRPLTIGRDCYLGMEVCVLYSGDIGDGAVVGAGSVVVDPVPAYSVAVGVPARVIRQRGQARSG